MLRMQMPKINFEITGLGKNLDRDDQIEGPKGDPSINDTLSSKQAFEGELKTEYEYFRNIDTYNTGREIFNVGYL